MLSKEWTEMYQQDLTKVWHGNQRMIKYCIGKTMDIVGLNGGRYFTIEKEKIEKNFCFGYSLSRSECADRGPCHPLRFLFVCCTAYVTVRCC